MTMKNILLSTLCILSVETATAQTLGYKIEGNISGLADGTTLTLTPVSTAPKADIATATVNGGHFAFSGTVSEPTAVHLKVKDTYGSTPLVLGDGDGISLSGSVSQSEQNGNSVYDFKAVKATGSAWTDKYQSMLGVVDYLDILYNSNHEVFKDFEAEYGKARLAKDKAACDSLNNTPLGRACNQANKIFFKACDDAYHKIAMDNKDSFFGPLSMVSLFSYLSEDQKSWYEAFSDEAKNSQYGKMVMKDVMPSSMVGEKAPTLSVTNDKGKQLTLKDLAKGKKYVLIDFWASWCQPCRKEIPNVKSLYAKYKDKGFEVVSISIDKKEADWRKALADEKLPWPNFRDTDGSQAMAWQVKFVPTMYIVKPDGTIVAENARGEKLAQKLAELF